MAKPKSSSSKNGQSSPSASDNPLSSTYSNASSIYTSSSNANSNGSQHLPQHIYYKTDLRREPSAASLTPPTTISMPIPPLPQRQHNPSMTSPVAGSGALSSPSNPGSFPPNSVYLEAISNSQRERELRERDFRSFSYNSADHQENPLLNNNSTMNSDHTSTPPYNPHQSVVSTSSSIASFHSSTSHASAAATERAANNPYSPSRNSSSSSHSSLQSFQPSHSAQTSSATQLSPVSSIRTVNQTTPSKKAKSIISRASMASIQSNSSTRSSLYDESSSTPSSNISSKKVEQISIPRPKDDAEIDRMFLELMVCFALRKKNILQEV